MTVYVFWLVLFMDYHGRGGSEGASVVLPVPFQSVEECEKNRALYSEDKPRTSWCVAQPKSDIEEWRK